MCVCLQSNRQNLTCAHISTVSGDENTWGTTNLARPLTCFVHELLSPLFLLPLFLFICIIVFQCPFVSVTFTPFNVCRQMICIWLFMLPYNFSSTHPCWLSLLESQVCQVVNNQFYSELRLPKLFINFLNQSLTSFPLVFTTCCFLPPQSAKWKHLYTSILDASVSLSHSGHLRRDQVHSMLGSHITGQKNKELVILPCDGTESSTPGMVTHR